MKYILKKVVCSILALGMGIILQGCKNSNILGNEEQLQIRLYDRKVTDLNITPDYVPNVYLMDMTDSLCFFGVEMVAENEDEEYQRDCSFYYQSLDATEEPVFITKTEGTWVLGMDGYTDVTGQDELCLLTLEMKDENENCVLSEYDCSGKMTNQLLISDEEFVRSRVSEVLRCKDGSYVVYSASELYTIDSTGTITGRTMCPDGYFQRALQMKDETVYITYSGMDSNKNCIAQVNVKNGLLSEKQSIPCAGMLACEMGEGKLLLMDSKAVYSYDVKAKKQEQLMEMNQYNIFLDRVVMLNNLEESIHILSWERKNELLPIELVTLTLKSEEELAKEQEEALKNPINVEKYDADGKRIITLYDPNGVADIFIYPEIVTDFNKNNDKYTVVLKSENPNVETVLADSESPDLMFIFESADVETYQKAGYLQDLTPFIERSNVLAKDDLQESVVNAFSYDSGLYALTSYCLLETLLCPKSQAGDKEGWTVDEFLSWLEDNKDVQSSVGLARDTVLTHCLKGNLEGYIDFQQMEADLTSEAFKNMLFRVKNLELSKDGVEHYSGAEISLNSVYLCNYLVSSVCQLTNTERFLGEELVLKGLPNDSGKQKVSLNCYGSLGILRKSECPEGAMAFIEHWLTYDAGKFDESSQSYDRKLWTVKSRMEREFESDQDYIISFDAEEAITMTITDEQEQMILKMLQMGELDTTEQKLIINIIMEEAQPYFLGQKDLDTVCDIMQSRVSILLSERR